MYVYVDGCDGDHAMGFLHMVWERGSLSLSRCIYIYIYFVCIRFPLSDGWLILWGPPFFQSSVFTGPSLLLNMWGPLFPCCLFMWGHLTFQPFWRFGILAKPKKGKKKTQKKRKDSQQGEFKYWRSWWGFLY